MEPTAKAHMIVAPAKILVEAAHQIDAAANEFDPGQCRDEFRILTGDILEQAALLTLTKQFCAEAPLATIRSISYAEDELEDVLASGRLDVCIGSFPSLSANVLQKTISEFSFGCFCNPSHPLAGRSVTLEELSKTRFAVMEGDSNLIGVIEQWLESNAVNRNIVVRTAHFQALSTLVTSSDLVAIVPTGSMRTWVFGGQVSPIHLPIEIPTLKINLYWHRIFHKDPRNKWFRNAVTDGMHEVHKMISTGVFPSFDAGASAANPL